MNANKQYPQYPNYKDSGVDWLGQIPAHWEVRRLGSKFEERKTKVSDKNYPALSVTKNGILPQLANAAKTNDGDNRKLVKKGDFVINSRSDRKGSSGISDRDGSVSLINTVITPIDIHPIFCHYLLRTHSFVEEFYKVGHGIVADLWTTRYDEMKKIVTAFPPLTEQQQIADYLDHKTALIEKAVALKQQQIALLQERLQILIQNAVTKGLNPQAPLKNSNIDWLEQIPTHWEVGSVKRFLKMPITDGPHTTPKLLDEGIPFISAEAIANGKINFNKKRGFISKKDYENFSKKYTPKFNDIYMVKSGATTGRVAMVKTDKKFTIWSPLAVFRCDLKKLEPEFLFLYLQSPAFLKSVELNWSYGTQQNIGMGVLGNLLIIVPPLAEQQQIADHLDKKSAETEQAIELMKEQIKLLQEYKNILINEAVTGKIRL